MWFRPQGHVLPLPNYTFIPKYIGTIAVWFGANSRLAESVYYANLSDSLKLRYFMP